VPVVLKFGNPNLLEPSGPVQACIGIPFTIFVKFDVLNGFSRWAGHMARMGEDKGGVWGFGGETGGKETTGET